MKTDGVMSPAWMCVIIIILRFSPKMYCNYVFPWNMKYGSDTRVNINYRKQIVSPVIWSKLHIVSSVACVLDFFTHVSFPIIVSIFFASSEFIFLSYLPSLMYQDFLLSILLPANLILTRIVLIYHIILFYSYVRGSNSNCWLEIIAASLSSSLALIY